MSPNRTSNKFNNQGPSGMTSSTHQQQQQRLHSQNSTSGTTKHRPSRTQFNGMSTNAGVSLNFEQIKQGLLQ
jgi:hypothetical protein